MFAQIENANCFNLDQISFARALWNPMLDFNVFSHITNKKVFQSNTDLRGPVQVPNIFDVKYRKVCRKP